MLGWGQLRQGIPLVKPPVGLTTSKNYDDADEWRIQSKISFDPEKGVDSGELLGLQVCFCVFFDVVYVVFLVVFRAWFRPWSAAYYYRAGKLLGRTCTLLSTCRLFGFIPPNHDKFLDIYFFYCYLFLLFLYCKSSYTGQEKSVESSQCLSANLRLHRR